MLISRRLLVAVSLIAAAVLATPALAVAAVAPMGLPQLAASADVVAVVKATEANSHRDSAKPGSVIRTETKLHLSKALKGTKPDAFALVQPGGTVDGVTLEVSEIPTLQPGERAIVFLDENGVVGGHQGMLAVEGIDVPALGMTLPEAERLIRGIVAGDAVPLPSTSAVAPALASAEPLSTTAPQLAEGSFAAAAAPVISSITPSGANGGTGQTVTVDGSGFGASAGSVSFIRGDSQGASRINGTIVSWSDTAVVVRVPSPSQPGPVVLTTSVGAASQGYSYVVGFSTDGMRWKSMPVNYRINENTADMTGEAAALQRAFTTWNSAGSKFRLGYVGTSSETAADPSMNGANDIYFAGTGFPSGVLAFNSKWYSGGTLLESNIVFNDTLTWGSTATGAWDLETIGLHELGHTVGLDDQYNATTRVMGAGVWGSARRQLSPTEIAGALWLHGADEATPDTAAPTAPTVSSSTHAAATTWYSSREPQFAFSATDDTGVTGYSYVMDQVASTTPDAVSEGAVTAKAYASVADGEWYFHVRAVDAAGNWGPASHMRIRIDGTAPVTGDDAVASYVGTATVVLGATDPLSGVASTDWTLDGTAGSGTVVRTSATGSHTLSYWSTDAAGNRELSRTVNFTVTATPVTPPTPTPTPEPTPTPDPTMTPEPTPNAVSTALTVEGNSRLTPSHNAKAYVVVNLTDSLGRALNGRQVTLQTSEGSVVATLTPGKVAGNYFGYAPVVKSRTTFRAVHRGDATYATSSVDVVVVPKAYVRLSAPSVAYRSRTFSAYGRVLPGDGPTKVRVEAWKRGGDGVYRRHKYTYLTTSNTYVTWRLALSAGRYRLRFVHQCSDHATSVSAWDYLSVR